MTGLRRWFTRQVALRLLAPALHRFGVRVYTANLHRIGDTLIDVGFYVKARELGWRGRERPIVIPAPPPRRPANFCVITYLRRHAPIVANRWLYPFLFLCSRDPETGGTLYGQLALADGRLVDQYLFGMAVEKQWEDKKRPPLLRLDAEHRDRGRRLLRDLGLSPEDWFVCLHVREPGFLREPPTSPHRHLNADIGTYVPVIRSIVAHGGWVVRMGDPTMKPLPQLERVVDYAHRPEKSDWMDVFLAASCRFWLGTNSGLFMLASTFGVPAALTNVAPATFRPWSYGDLFIPKLYHSPREQRVLTFGESLAPSLYSSWHLDTEGVVPIENDEEDLVDLAEEMHARITGRLEYGERDEALQARFNSLYPADYYPDGVTSRIGSRFLVKHESLLD
jgi:putative glycosyltransferase (TIGR04372 family)